LADIFQISPGSVLSLLLTTAGRGFDHPTPIGRPTPLTPAREQSLIWEIVCDAHEEEFITKAQLLDRVDKQYQKSLTFGWVDVFLARTADSITCSKIIPQKDPRMQVPRDFLDQYIVLIKTHVIGMDSGIVYKRDQAILPL
jgi:hypothetical protein